MTPKEISTFCKRFMLQFPEYGRWILDGIKCDEQQAQREAWVLCLSDIDERDANAVLERLVRGEDKLPEAYERSRFPAAVREYCRESAARRSRQTARRAEHPQRGPIAGGSAAALFQQLVALKDAGMSQADAVDQVMASQVVDAEHEPRYSCLTCHDDGLALVWHTAAVQAVLRSEFDPQRHALSMVVPCACRRGRDKVKPGKWDESAVYSPAKYCLFNDGNATALKDWVAVRQTEAWDRRRFKDFDAFNQREATEAF